MDWCRSAHSVFDKLCTRHRAVEGRAAVWHISKRRVCMHRLLLSVGLIAQQRRGSVRWAAGQGINQPPEPTADAYWTHNGRSFSLNADTGHYMAEVAVTIKGSRRRKCPRHRRRCQWHPLIAAARRVMTAVDRCSCCPHDRSIEWYRTGPNRAGTNF